MACPRTRDASSVGAASEALAGELGGGAELSAAAAHTAYAIYTPPRCVWNTPCQGSGPRRQQLSKVLVLVVMLLLLLA